MYNKHAMSLPIIAIVGRPNVGKSTLFNRLIGKRYAVTSSVPGTTRDRIYHETEIDGSKAILIDTGGMEFEKKENIEADVQTQAKIAVLEADMIFFVSDATSPLLKSDFDCAQYLRKSKKPVLLIANKSDNKKSEQNIPQLYKFGFGDPVLVSSIHNQGIDDLELAAKKILRKLKKKPLPLKKKNSIAVAITGKPNVGKSSIINALLNKQRFIVSDKPGTTIDSIDTDFKYQNQDFCLIDTAGIRRRGKIEKGIEKFGVFRSLQAISRADVACLILDLTTGVANQDLHVSEYILEAGKGLIIVVNKEDLMKNKQEDQKKILRFLQYRMSYIPWAPVIFTSAITKKNIFQIFALSKNISEERKKKISQSDFSLFVKATIFAHPPTRSNRKIIMPKGEQSDINPPEFTFYTNHPDLIHFSYRRFLENEIRRKYGFYGTPIRITFRKI